MENNVMEAKLMGNEAMEAAVKEHSMDRAGLDLNKPAFSPTAGCFRDDESFLIIAQEPPLWGMRKGKHFYHCFVLVTLYKDCYAIGQDQLYNEVKKSLQHNIHILHHIHKKWAQTVTHLGNLTTWHRLTAKLNLTGPVEGGCLWMDSFNIQLSGVTCILKKDLAWSYKLNSPGQHFMVLLNAHGQFQALWGGYSPKIFDGDFLKIQQ
ncbi:uncharacterized protein ACA1_376440 [Acanthamoeba castellanii str. Neff]|uniref:Uncharacterized protein n=1 Tax=Acanthamoeba castellanii (strain ATCC 30010 / Neff) TaxID=1257118 RepID=L8HIG3_ACACF|nr:uncharacterized protein ACA1_376440 [Acanthamoeba castellanii str. Neff]ELR24171.1 hypothetical protein ACA1_376440 [Acanthamoeba castellanii str. Neff]